MTFRYYLRVRYGECDAQKVVFNARYGEYVDLAVTEFFRAIGYGAEMASCEVDFQLVKQTTEWKAPIRFDEVAEISVSLVRLGTTSFTLACEFRVAGQPDVTARSETVYVLVDEHLSKRPLPPELRQRIEQGSGVQTDHAGWLRS